ncbi:glycosyltransferase [Flavobacterium urumqiense]|uniref:Glycosyltransferase involved in cell wall bisynthesis n=1 Tax=Flavobacterium urumqiense TaxID=935224 RepID=A0A1H5Y3T1_9FLAO|nr:glycosyltransferase [Flavobacterium urumqiense]SEG18492.1 Glycosyltransferase involved in cell wall bisynthesis [Flavobacterium urumqiense]
MQIILFVHPTFLGSQSMPRYANMIAEGMKHREHRVQIWMPKARFYNLPLKGAIKKWLGYVDQYIMFPFEVQFKLKHCAANTLFVFADQALGPWVPLVKNRPHVVHCHDFLALNSALGNIPENQTSFTGKMYQNFIRNGFSKGKNFISISQKTQDDLHLLHQGNIETSVVCYNGMNRPFEVLDTHLSRTVLGKEVQINLVNGYVLHVGGNQFYKNRKGVIEIYTAWRSNSTDSLPLLLVGSDPSEELEAAHQNSAFKKDIHFITGLPDTFINEAYSGASCLLFPSLDEGFGWPIAEAMACGCPVITTDVAPMTEVIGEANFFLIPKRPFDELLVQDWAVDASQQITNIVQLSDEQKKVCLDAGFESIKRFDTTLSLDSIEKVYQSILPIR